MKQTEKKPDTMSDVVLTPTESERLLRWLGFDGDGKEIEDNATDRKEKQNSGSLDSLQSS